MYITVYFYKAVKLDVLKGHMEQSVSLNVCVRMELHVIPKECASVLEDGL